MIVPGHFPAQSDRNASWDHHAAEMPLDESAPDRFPIPGPIYSDRESGNDEYAALPNVIRACEMAEPEPREYMISGLIPTGAVSSLYGDGGFGKSLLALHMSAHVALGIPWLGHKVKKGVVLYLDAELDGDEFSRRAYRVARGLGRSAPPDGLYYYRITGSLAQEYERQRVRSVVHQVQPDFVVLDSLMVASAGRDFASPNDTIIAFKEIEAWGVTVLAIDHTPKAQPGIKRGDQHAFGSAFKRNMSRSTLQLIGTSGNTGALQVAHTKHNFGPREPTFALELKFESNTITISSMSVGDERLAELDDHISTLDRHYRELLRHPDGISAHALAEALDEADKTAQNNLSRLRGEGRARSSGDGKWFPIPDSPKEGRESGNGLQSVTNDLAALALDDDWGEI